MLNHAGVCLSYYSTWEHLRKMADESKFLERIQQHQHLFVYDNLNIYTAVHHEREGMSGRYVLKIYFNVDHLMFIL